MCWQQWLGAKAAAAGCREVAQQGKGLAGVAEQRVGQRQAMSVELEAIGQQEGRGDARASG